MTWGCCKGVRHASGTAAGARPRDRGRDCGVTALTYAEAQQRSRLIGVLAYQVDLDVSGGDEVFGSVTTVRFRCREPGAGSFVELRPALLRRAVLNGRDLDTAA